MNFFNKFCKSAEENFEKKEFVKKMLKYVSSGFGVMELQGGRN